MSHIIIYAKEIIFRTWLRQNTNRKPYIAYPTSVLIAFGICNRMF